MPEDKKQQSDHAFAVPKRIINAISIVQSTDETRYVLNGQHYTFDVDGSVTVVATDGRRLAAVRKPHMHALKLDKPIEFIADLTKVKLPLKKGLMDYHIIPNDDLTRLEVFVEFLGPHVTVPTIEGNYPNWRNVVPKKTTTKFEWPVYNIGYMVDWFRIINQLFPKNTAVQFQVRDIESENGQQVYPELVLCHKPEDYDEEFIGILMPMRVTSNSEIPDWAKIKD